LGRLTLGITTECRALGASLGAALGSPPGWYWYFPEVPDCHGAEFGAILTGCSDEEEVGLRATLAHVSHLSFTLVRRAAGGMMIRQRTKIESSNSVSKTHYAQKDLHGRSCQSALQRSHHIVNCFWRSITWNPELFLMLARSFCTA